MFVATEQEMVSEAQTLCFKCTPILVFATGQVRQRNGVKQPEIQILDIKYVVRNQTDVVEHRNGVKIPKI